MSNETSSTGDSRRGVLKRGAAMLGTLKLGSLIAGTASGYQDEKYTSPNKVKADEDEIRRMAREEWGPAVSDQVINIWKQQVYRIERNGASKEEAFNEMKKSLKLNCPETSVKKSNRLKITTVSQG